MRLFPVAIIAYAFYLVILDFALMAAQTPIATQMLISGSSAALFFSWLGWSDYCRRQEIHFLQLLAVGGFLQLGIGGIYVGAVVASGDELVLRQIGLLFIEKMPPALFLMQISILTFLCGGYLSSKRVRATTVENQSKFLSDILIWLFVMTGWGYKMAVAAGFQGLGVLGRLLWMLPLAGSYWWTLQCADNNRGRFKYGVFAFIIIAIEMWIARESSMRSHYLVLFLPVCLAVAFILKKKRGLKRLKPPPLQPVHLSKISRRRGGRRRITLYAVGFFLISFVLLILFPAASIVKRKESDRIDKAVVYVLKNFFDKAEEIHGYPEKGIFALANRMAFIIGSGSIVLDLKDNDIPMEYSPLLNFSVALIPRVFWEDKPIISSGKWFADFLYRGPGNLHTALALSAAGELFWRYGWFGTVAIMFITGWILQRIWMYCLMAATTNPFAVITLISIAHNALKNFESQWSAPLSLIVLSFFATVGYAFLRIPAKKAIKRQVSSA